MISEESSISEQFLLLHRNYRFAGWILFSLGIVLSIIRFYYGIKLQILDLKTFAIYSSFFETKTFVVIRNNLTEETAALLALVGLLFITFSKEEEENQDVSNLRLRSLITAFYVNTIFLIISIFFVFGIGFVEVMMVNLFTPFLFYLIIFKYNIHKRTTSERNYPLTKEE